MVKGKVILTESRNTYQPRAMEYAEITYDVDEFGSKALLYCKNEQGSLEAIYNLNNPTVRCVIWEK